MPPPDDPTLFMIFLLAPVVLGTGIYLFFFKRKLHKKANWSLLLQGNLLILLTLFSVVLLVGEIYYRFVYDETDSFALTKPTNRWIRRYIKEMSNSWDFRDNQQYTLTCPPGKTRITFIGDSFTVGHGIRNVDKRFANLVRHQNEAFDVQALAGNGMDTGHQLKLLTTLGDTELQYVVLVYCLNDVSDIVPEYQQILDQIYERQPGYLVENSYFLNTLYYRWIAFADPEIKNFYQFTLKAYESSVWEEQKERLAAFRDAIKDRNAQLMVVTFPFIHALGKNYAYAQVHQQLDEHWKSLDVPHLDLYDVYEGHTAEEMRVNQYDAHPNERAHAMAATAIGEFLRTQIKEASP